MSVPWSRRLKPGKTARARRVRATTLTCSMSAIVEGFASANGPISIVPALLTSNVIEEFVSTAWAYPLNVLRSAQVGSDVRHSDAVFAFDLLC